MEIFLSWGGEKSKAVARALREWLPCLFQSVSPWMSTRDLRVGVRWSHELAEILERTEFGIVCLTEENLKSPWICFEAGALSRAVQRSRLVPYLIDVPMHSFDGPLAQFQAVLADQEGTRQLVETISAANPSNRQDERTADHVFEVWWPQFHTALDDIHTRFPLPKIRRPEIRILTSTDIEIVRHLADGMELPRIAQVIGCTISTLHVRIQQVLLKLNADSRAHAVELAKELELI